MSSEAQSPDPLFFSPTLLVSSLFYRYRLSSHFLLSFVFSVILSTFSRSLCFLLLSLVLSLVLSLFFFYFIIMTMRIREREALGQTIKIVSQRLVHLDVARVLCLARSSRSSNANILSFPSLSKSNSFLADSDTISHGKNFFGLGHECGSTAMRNFR